MQREQPGHKEPRVSKVPLELTVLMVKVAKTMPMVWRSLLHAKWIMIREQV